MFKNIEEVKKFITWCKENKVKAFNSENVTFELSELSFIENQNYDEIKMDDTKTFSDLSNLEKDETEELLFWSSNNKG